VAIAEIRSCAFRKWTRPAPASTTFGDQGHHYAASARYKVTSSTKSMLSKQAFNGLLKTLEEPHRM
jgi:hypothetical protein